MARGGGGCLCEVGIFFVYQGNSLGELRTCPRSPSSERRTRALDLSSAGSGPPEGSASLSMGLRQSLNQVENERLHYPVLPFNEWIEESMGLWKHHY